MLELRDITKVYVTGEFKQIALDRVSINFRKSEFASILGPSGSGKTTLLNIVGGLDKYTTGDLIINEKSTKMYKDSDWDSYRNHRIGFIFQSYNLISHQTILQNVLLALTISGLSKKAGIEKAKQALIDVGLEDHIYKKPNQLSGGQMQRVAIARALVNDPDIILADEPTGALDSETSTQIMKVLKDISKDKLVIMVTHNPELANDYSTRIINLKDGRIISDTNPYNTNNTQVKDKYIRTKKTVMSYFTALNLSFNNLMTKKGRTILTSFAGSIGIIGISLILALSTGFQNYIDKIQEDTLSSYPLTITSETADMTSMLLGMMSGSSENVGTNIVTEQQYVADMFSNISTNDLKSFKKYVEIHNEELKGTVASVKYNYSVDPIIYTTTPENEISKVNPSAFMSSLTGSSSMSSLSSMYSSYSSVFSQMTDDVDSLKEQYDVLSGKWPTAYNEMILVLSEPNAIPDMLVYFLGLRDLDELDKMITDIMAGEEVVMDNEPLKLTYEDFLNLKFKLIIPTDTFKYNEKYNIYEDMSDDEDYMNKLYNSAESLKIVGVVCAKKGSSSMALTPGVHYTSDLVKHIISKTANTGVVKKQLANKEVDVFSNTRFDEKKPESDLKFEDMISVDEKILSEAFGGNIDKDAMSNSVKEYMSEISSSITVNTVPATTTFTNSLSTIATGLLKDYIKNPKNVMANPMDPDNEIALISINDVDKVVDNYLKKETNQIIFKDLEKKYVIPADVFESTISQLLNGLLKGYVGTYYASNPSLTIDPTNPTAALVSEAVEPTVSGFMNQAVIQGTCSTMGGKMTEASMQKNILTSVGNLTTVLTSSLFGLMDIDAEKLSSAFKFELDEDELSRLMTTMMSGSKTGNVAANLATLGYQDLDDPTSMSIYFVDFEAKERFLDLIEKYNQEVISHGEEAKKIDYTDITGILMSSVKTIVNSVSYVLIAFVSISLVVSSIMIGVITYISVLERTKEIGILRAIGASKSNISSIFNAETFIIGLLSGLIGIGISLALVPIINIIIHELTGNPNLSADLPLLSSLLLILLAIVLTIVGGLIPSHKASKQDPVIALRTE